MEEVSFVFEARSCKVDGVETEVVEKTKITLRSSER